MAKGPVAPGIWAQEGKDGFRSEKLGGSEVYSAYKIPPPLWREALGKQLAERKAGNRGAALGRNRCSGTGSSRSDSSSKALILSAATPGRGGEGKDTTFPDSALFLLLGSLGLHQQRAPGTASPC